MPSTPSVFESLKPGQSIRCTLLKDVRPGDAQDTILRLMRFDAKTKRLLKSAQEHRMRTLVVKSRGKRPWEVRERSSKLVSATKGATWTMKFFPHVAPDFRSVAAFLKVEAD